MHWATCPTSRDTIPARNRWKCTWESPVITPRASTSAMSKKSSSFHSKRWNTPTSTMAMVTATTRSGGLIDAKLLHEVFLNTGLYLLFGGIVIGLISGLQGEKVTRDDDNFFVTLFQGVLCLFLARNGDDRITQTQGLEVGRPWVYRVCLDRAQCVCDVRDHRRPHLFPYDWQPFELGSYVLFAVLCAAASYIAVPAVQRLAIPEASPTLPLAASLGLTFSYNVTIGIPIYIVIAKQALEMFPVA